MLMECWSSVRSRSRDAERASYKFVSREMMPRHAQPTNPVIVVVSVKAGPFSYFFVFKSLIYTLDIVSVMWGMTGASPVTTILFAPSGRSHAVPCIVVTGLAPVMLPICYNFLNVQLTFPNKIVSPSLSGVALSGSSRLLLIRVELVLFRSVSV